MRKKPVVALICGAALVAGAGGYTVADAYDKVPGFITLQAPPSPAPIPTQPPITPAPELPTQTVIDLPPITSAHVKPLWDEFAQSAGQARPAAIVIDALTGNILLEQNADVAMEPASTTKILTAYSAAQTLDFTRRFITEVTIDETGALHLTGNGDLLLSEDAGNTDRVNGYAGIGDLAQQVANALGERKPKTLIYHPKLFDGPTRETTLPEGLTNWVGHVGAFAINRGQLPGEGYPPYRDDPGEHVAQTLQARLAEHGIEVTATASDEAAPGGLEILGSVKSATLGQIMQLMLSRSDNTLAEHLCRLSSQAAGQGSTLQDATANLRQTIIQAGLAADDLQIFDCSGLNENNRITARTTATTLQTLWNSRTGAAESGSDAAEKEKQVSANERSLLRDLAYAWMPGTLNERFLNEHTVPRVQGKTGSLDQSSALAGFATTEAGRVLIFQIQVDSTPDSGYSYREAIDRFAVGLTRL